MKAFAEEEYRKALQRLIERDEPISLNKVALEAGKKPGSLREKRYPEVCEEVKKAIEDKEQKAGPKLNKKKKDKDEVIKEMEDFADNLRMRNAIFASKIVSLENQLFEVMKELEELRSERSEKKDKKISKINDHL